MAARVSLLCAAFVVLGAIVYAMGPARILAIIRVRLDVRLDGAAVRLPHCAARSDSVAKPAATSFSLPDVLRIRFAAEAVEMLTFTGPFLAEPAKGWMFVRRGVTLADAAGAIAFEYLTYTLVAADIALAALGVLLHRHAFSPAVPRPFSFWLYAWRCSRRASSSRR